MGKLICTEIMSLDGYINDQDGKFDWSAPDAEVHQFVNDIERPIGTYLLGRRLYEVMKYWETAHLQEDVSPVELDFARLWQAADKVVYSSTLESVDSERTRIERSFDPDAIRTLKEGSDRDLSIGGPGLSGHAYRAGLIDEVRLFLSPVIIGGGTRGLPDRARLDLSLAEERRFGNGVVYLRYEVTRS
ncbi:dihydrofolate reductase family protein [Actinoplanes sp. NPDC051633]|uniref:dihydrofolate reductase family protein n=1 Tax=Actinoplanes sp. NPDC051633 TaxID=3155670 RepID=UPI0034382B14